ncbi:hypothetical protein T492DRAFT_207446 [Pavlovales sp. CCMP2436]|nr:hypothetical protein T492DRAFT_207446 [Pavlovales sp. CCMP2436]
MSGAQTLTELGQIVLDELAHLHPNEWALLFVVVAPMVALLLSPLSFKRLEVEEAPTASPPLVAGSYDESLSSELRQMHRLQRSHEQLMLAVQFDVRSLGKELHQLGSEIAEAKKAKPVADSVRPRSPAPAEANLHDGMAPRPTHEIVRPRISDLPLARSLITHYSRTSAHPFTGRGAAPRVPRAMPVAHPYRANGRAQSPSRPGAFTRSPNSR